MWLPSLALALAPQTAEAVDLSTAVVDGQGPEIRASCRLELPGLVSQQDSPGVLRIVGDRSREVRVEFSGSLQGSEDGTPPDAYTGVGIQVTGPNVVLVAPRVRGFRIGIEAVEADGLVVLDADVSDNFRQRLASTWERGDLRDWIDPHDADDEGLWKTRYGAGLAVERSSGIRVQGLRARNVQNGILLDRVADSVVTGCDASFLSGWGCALRHSSRNRIEANRFEFCVRGYSHDRYFGGLGSAGLLIHDESTENVVQGNSLTHAGAGALLFADLGGLTSGQGAPRGYRPGQGSNGNEFALNDLSFAASHGLGLHFSFSNDVHHNVFEGNAISGSRLTYSRGAVVHGNNFMRNGQGQGRALASFGNHRGAVMAMDTQRAVVRDNHFLDNPLAVRIWSDEDRIAYGLPWSELNGRGAADNEVWPPAVPPESGIWLDRLRWPTSDGQWPRVEIVDAARTRVYLPDSNPGLAIDAASASTRIDTSDEYAAQRELRELGYGPPGPSVPASRQALQGPAYRQLHDLAPLPPLTREDARRALPSSRAAIVVTEWGPYDWSVPYVQPLERGGARHTYRLLGPDSLTSVAVLRGSGAIDVTFDKALPDFPAGPDGLAQGVVRITPRETGRPIPYALIVRARGNDLPVSGVLLPFEWDVAWFANPPAMRSDEESLLWGQVDPSAHREAWLAAAETPVARARLPRLDLGYGWDGPAALALEVGLPAPTVAALEALGRDGFSTLARTTATLAAGTWRIRTLSNDGIRVLVDGEPVIDQWTLFGSGDDEALVNVAEERPVEIAVEHFDFDAYSTLNLTIEPAEGPRTESR